MGGLFDTFTVAKRGLSVQQGNINTTSHNIANAQTEGYSRQRAIVKTTRPFGGMSRFDTTSAGQVGTGAEITQIMRVRDSFLDYQVRAQTTDYGTVDTKNQYLSKVEGILNETTSTGIQGALTEFYNKFQTLSKQPQVVSNRTQAITQAKNVAEALNSRYKQLAAQKSDAQGELSTSVTDMNNTLDKINDLNKQIAKVCVGGMSPNDLMDSRDLLIDQLSSKFGVKISKQQREAIDLSVAEDSSVGNLVNSSPTDENYSRFSYVENAVISGTGASKKLEVTYNVLGDKNNQKTIEITTGDLEGLQKNLLEDRVLVSDKDGNVVSSNTVTATSTAVTGDKSGTVTTLAADGTGTIVETIVSGTTKTVKTTTKSTITDAAVLDKSIFNNVTNGEIAGNQQVQDSIQGYMDQLDKFTASFAYAVNAIQTGTTDESSASNILDKNGVAITNPKAIFVVKKDDGTVTSSDTGITAKNITINSELDTDSITNNPGLLNCGVNHVDDVSGESDGTRALAIADLKNLKIDIGSETAADIVDRKTFYKGVSPATIGTSGIDFASDNMNLTNKKDGTGTTLMGYYGSLVGNVYTKAEGASDDVYNQKVQLAQYTNDRLSVSGVSIDEETADLIQYQHSYQANAKMISTIDELLDVVINGLKR